MRRALTGLLVVVAGCSEWPRFANIPEDSSLDGDPRERVDVDWRSPVQESGENDQPGLDLQSFSPTLQTGDVVEGAIDGFLWGDTAIPELIEAPDGVMCEFTEGVRSPGSGDYLGDVDFYLVSFAEDATLCAEARFPQDLDGRIWDLLLMPIDDCGVPGQPYIQGDAPLGFSLSEQQAFWSQRVPPGQYVLGLGGASYAGSQFDFNASRTYSLSISAVSNNPDGSEGLCPLPGFEGP